MRFWVVLASLSLLACKQDIGIGSVITPEPPSPTADPDPQPTPVPTPDPTGTPTPDPGSVPVAQCGVSATTVLPFHEEITFDGSASYDPSGLAITEYRWELSEKPQGSSVEMPAGDAVRSGFTTDQAGLYVARLIVVNSEGNESLACEVQLEAVPAESLWVEMFWDQDGDDMDLHLLAPGGTIGTITDCYYGNCRPPDVLDWGVAAYSGDNPALDQDDTQTSGPENINILAPSPGIYTVAVRDFGNDPQIASTNVTVNIYLDGVLMWTDTRVITGDPTLAVEFAEIDWPAGVITSL